MSESQSSSGGFRSRRQSEDGLKSPNGMSDLPVDPRIQGYPMDQEKQNPSPQKEEAPSAESSKAEESTIHNRSLELNVNIPNDGEVLPLLSPKPINQPIAVSVGDTSSPSTSAPILSPAVTPVKSERRPPLDNTC